MRDWLAATLAAVLIAGCSGSKAPPAPSPTEDRRPLTVALEPGLQAGTKGADAIAGYLSARAGVPVRMAAPAGYPELVTGLAAGQYDAAVVATLPYAALGARAGDVVARGPSVESIVVCNALARVPALHDGGDWSALRGRSFAFGDAKSLPSSLWPRYYLIRNHVDPDRDLVKPEVLPTATSIALAAYNNTANCGALYGDARQGAVQQAPDIVAKTQLVFTAPEEIPGDAVVVRHGLPAARRARLQSALVALGTDKSMSGALGTAFGAPALVQATDRDYEVVRRVVSLVDPGLLAPPA